MTNETLVRCFACSAICQVDELSLCLTCGVGVCYSTETTCNGRCVCESLRHLEHPEDAKAFYSIMDELNVCDDAPRQLYLETQLEQFEQQHGW
jgi:hypothetical protein